jgi:hypothetical protein
MATPTAGDIKRAFLAALPKDGSSIGNIRLRRDLAETLGQEIAESLYEQVRDELIAEGKAAKGQGRGGSVRRLEAHDQAEAAQRAAGRKGAELSPRPARALYTKSSARSGA